MRDAPRRQEQNQTIHALLGTVDRYRDAIETYRAEAVQLRHAVAPDAAPPSAAVAPPAAVSPPAAAFAPPAAVAPPAAAFAPAAAAAAPPAAASAPPAAAARRAARPDGAAPPYDFAHVINPMPAKGTAAGARPRTSSRR